MLNAYSNSRVSEKACAVRTVPQGTRSQWKVGVSCTNSGARSGRQRRVRAGNVRVGAVPSHHASHFPFNNILEDTPRNLTDGLEDLDHHHIQEPWNTSR